MRLMRLTSSAMRLRSRQARRSVLSQALTMAISAQFRFALDDIKRLDNEHLLHKDIDTAYALAVAKDNTSFCMAVEHFTKRGPFFLDKARLYLGATFFWEGQKVQVTSFPDCDTLRAAYYGEGNRPLRYHVISRAALAAEERMRRKADSLRSLAELLAPGRPVVIWGPPPSPDHLEHWMCLSGVHLFRSSDPEQAIDVLLGHSSWARVRREMASFATLSRRASEPGSMKVAPAKDGGTEWSYWRKDTDERVSLPASQDAFDDAVYARFLETRGALGSEYRYDHELVLRTAASAARRRHAAVHACWSKFQFNSHWCVSKADVEGGVRVHFKPESSARRAVSLFVPSDPTALTASQWEEAVVAARELDIDYAENMLAADEGMTPLFPGVLVACSDLPAALEQAASDAGAFVVRLPGPAGAEEALDALRARFIPDPSDLLWADRSRYGFSVTCRSARLRDIESLWWDIGLRDLRFRQIGRSSADAWANYLKELADPPTTFSLLLADEDDDEARAAAERPGVVLLTLNPSSDQRLVANEAAWQFRCHVSATRKNAPRKGARSPA